MTLEYVSDQHSMQSISVYGQTIRYYDIGSGTVIVLIHAMANTALSTWGKVLAPLAETHRILAMDQIGFGASDKPGIEFRIQTFVEFLGEFLRLHRIEQFILAGQSLGGWIAAQYTIQALQSDNPPSGFSGKLPIPNKLILSDAAGLRMQISDDVLHGSLPDSINTQKESMKNVVYDQSLINDEMARKKFVSRLAANDGLTIRSFLSSLQSSTEWLDGQLQHITIPTLVTWGSEDRIVPLMLGKRLTAQIPNAKMVIIEQCGHEPMNEKPDVFLANIREFIE
jgi:pimeloyl-ACP methyl ester carboxylesterase